MYIAKIKKNMKIIKTKISGLFIIKPKNYKDKRGFFYESYVKKKYGNLIKKNFCQDNVSLSKKNVLRGIHFQLPPFSQGKLVRVIDGEVLDVAVDLRKSSRTFGKWVSVTLSSKKNNQLWIPEGFGHGFVVKSETAHLLYKTTNYYNKESEESIIWNDKTLSIDWGIKNPNISKKDREAKDFINVSYFTK